MSVNKAQANRLWDEVRNGFIVAQDAIKKIIEERAWEPLGYASFVAAWEDRMRGIQLAESLRGEIIYAMFDLGATDAEIANAIDNVGPVTVKGVRDAHDRGLPADKAIRHANMISRQKRIDNEDPTVVRQHTRKRPDKDANVHIHVGHTKLTTWRAYAEKNDLDLKSWMEELLIQAVDDKIYNDDK